MVRKLFIALSTVALVVLVGCSGFDTNQVIIHPEQVKPSTSFNVALVNIYTYLSMDSVLTADVKRDSLHLLVGLPASWNVESATMVVADDMTTTQLIGMQENALDQQALAALLIKYASKMVTLPANALLAAKVSGDTIAAHDQASGAEIPVAIDDVSQWKGFSAPVNILLAAGSKPDTMIAMDSITGLAGSEDTSLSDITSSGLMPEEVGVTMIPVIVLLNVKAGPGEGTDTLYYFSKTGAMNPPASAISALLPDAESKEQLAAMEAGSMSFVPITVSAAAAVAGDRATDTRAKVTAVSNRIDGSVVFELGTFSTEKSLISIYSLQGSLVASVAPQAQTSVWNGCDLRGNRLPAGAYVARIGRGASSQSLRVQLMQ